MYCINQTGGCAGAGRNAPPGAPATRGGAAAALLDNRAETGQKEALKPQWGQKQWKLKRVIRDRLNLWHGEGYQVLWVTLTSAPDSTTSTLREHFKVLKKRIQRQLGFDPLEYVCVDTHEGHGVLHMLWAWKDPKGKRYSFYIPFDWLQENWKELHGAFMVNIQRVGGNSKDAQKVSSYMVSQYCAGQNALVRLSQSKPHKPLTVMRRELFAAIRNLPERYEAAAAFSHLPDAEFHSQMNKLKWGSLHKGWEHLVRTGSCKLFDVQFAWMGDHLERV